MTRSLALLALALAFSTTTASTQAATYSVTFDGTWSSERYPDDFPLLAHFSPLIGATHDERFDLVDVGGMATDGLEHLSEEGKHQPFDAEIQAGMEAGSVGALVETTEPIRELPGTATTQFTTDEKHAMLSVVAMIAPSPDWFAAALDVNLRDGGGWVKEISVPLVAHDAGTDTATSYRALDANQEPRGVVQPNPSPYFAGDRRVVGMLTLRRVR